MNALRKVLEEHPQLVGWMTGLSGLVFVGSLIVVPWIVVRIPEDYFSRPDRDAAQRFGNRSVWFWIGMVVKNLGGALLVLAGIAMLVLPGQGLLTIAIGMLLLNFPGRHQLASRIIHLKPVWNSVNWLRRKANVPPLMKDPREDADAADGVNRG